MQVGLVGN